MKEDKLDKLVLTLVLVLLVLIIFFSFRAYANYAEFKAHRAYLLRPDAQVQPWMTIHTVERQFNISRPAILQQLNETDSLGIEKLSIDSICKQRRLNCSSVISSLNALHD